MHVEMKFCKLRRLPIFSSTWMCSPGDVGAAIRQILRDAVKLTLTKICNWPSRVILSRKPTTDNTQAPLSNH